MGKRGNPSAMTYREPMPEDCPPVAAQEITDERVVFRLAKTNPATLDDFRSQRAINPNAKFNVMECLARGLSVHADRRDSEQAKKLPKFQRCVICSVRLEAGAGRIQQTFKPSHHTWWPFAGFDILAHCG